MATFVREIDDLIGRLGRAEIALDQVEDERTVPAALDLAELAGDLHSLCLDAREDRRPAAELAAPEPELVERILVLARDFASRAEDVALLAPPPPSTDP